APGRRPPGRRRWPRNRGARRACSSSPRRRRHRPARATMVTVQGVSLQPDISVILVPDTYRPSFPSGLDALRVQNGRYAIVLVDWEGGPSYRHLLDGLPGTYARCPLRGRAAMNNLGVAKARAPLLCFLADDFVPGPGFVEAYLAHHAARPEPTRIGI